MHVHLVICINDSEDTLNSAVKALIKAGGNVNQAQTTDDASPLYIASHNGNVAIVKALIKAGGNVNQARATDGAGMETTVKLLVEADCDVNVQDSNGNTAMHFAVSKGILGMVQILKEKGASPLINNKHSAASKC